MRSDNAPGRFVADDAKAQEVPIDLLTRPTTFQATIGIFFCCYGQSNQSADLILVCQHRRQVTHMFDAQTIEHLANACTHALQ